MLSEPEQQRVLEAVLEWAKYHPAPDLPMLQMGQVAERLGLGRQLTPREIAFHLERRTEVGQHLITLIDSVTDSVPVDEVVRDLVSYRRG